MKRLALILAALWPTLALAQAPTAGPLLIQRGLGEIAQQGSAAQAQARASLNLGGAATLNVGTTAGTVADGGALTAETAARIAAIQSALPATAGALLGTSGTAGLAQAITPGTGLVLSSGILSVPAATSSVLGGVKQGANVSIAGDGTLSASGAVQSVAGLTGTPTAAQIAATMIGTTTGTVGDGGVLAATQTTANAALPASGGTLSGGSLSGTDVSAAVVTPTNGGAGSQASVATVAATANNALLQAADALSILPGVTSIAEAALATANAALPASGGTLSGGSLSGTDVSAAVVTPTNGGAGSQASVATVAATANAALPASGGDASATTVTATGGTAARTLAARAADVINVLDYGATGNGTTDDTAAIQAAATACPAGGCTLLFPSGYSFMTSSPILLSSHTHVIAKGATILPTAGATFKNLHNGSNQLNTSAATTNSNTLTFTSTTGAAVGQQVVAAGIPFGTTVTAVGSTTVTLSAAVTVASGAPILFQTDTDITIEGGTIDYRLFSGDGGATHAIEFNFMWHAEVLHSVGYGANPTGGVGDFVAFVGCNDTLVDGNFASGFTNATADHWWGASNARVVNNHFITNSLAQFVNFNPEATTGSSTGLVANGFDLSHNTLICTATAACTILTAPLTAGTTVQNVSIDENILENTWVVPRGSIQGVSVTNNRFIGPTSGIQAIASYPDNGGTPDSVIVSGNTIIGPATNSGNLGVITLEGTNSAIKGNTISGGSAYAATYTGTYPVVISGNNGFGNCGHANLGSTWVADDTLPSASASSSFMLTGATYSADGLIKQTQLPLADAKNANGTAITNATSAGAFALSWGSGTVNRLVSENANNSTITDTVGWEFVLPPTYVAGSNITVMVWCYYVLGSGTIGAHTLKASAYTPASPGGALSSNLIATVPQSISTSSGWLNFTITGTTLAPGARMLLLLQMALQDTSGNNIYGYIFNANLQ
jgi:hypothetical protein